MKKEEFDNIKEILLLYKNRKEIILKPLFDYRKMCKEKGMYMVEEDRIARDVYVELYECIERKKFVDLAKRTKSDSEFEKYFRAAFFEIFEGRIIDPKTF